MKNLVILIKEKNLAFIEDELTFLELNYNVTICRNISNFIEIVDIVDYHMLILDLAFKVEDLSSICSPFILKWKFKKVPIVFISRRKDYDKLNKLPVNSSMRCYTIPFDCGELFHRAVNDNMLIHAVMNLERSNKHLDIPIKDKERYTNNLDENLENKHRIIRLINENRKLTNELGFHQVDFETVKIIQSQFMPQKDKTFLGCEFSRFIMPSKYLTGDFMDYFKLDDDHCAFYLADVAGHGLKAGIISIFFKSFLNRFKTENKLDFNPAEVIFEMNEELINLKIGVHITIFAGLINVKDNLLTYCNAGQYPLPIINNGEEISFIEENNLPVGIIENPEYKNSTIKFGKNNSLLVVSDGVLEIIMDKSLDDKKKILLSSLINSSVTIAQIASHFGVLGVKEFPDDISSLLIKRV